MCGGGGVEVGGGCLNGVHKIAAPRRQQQQQQHTLLCPAPTSLCPGHDGHTSPAQPSQAKHRLHCSCPSHFPCSIIIYTSLAQPRAPFGTCKHTSIGVTLCSLFALAEMRGLGLFISFHKTFWRKSGRLTWPAVRAALCAPSRAQARESGDSACRD